MKTSLFNRIIALITALLIPLNSIAFADVLIDLDITEIDPGPLETIENTGSLEGDFEAEFDIPNVETIDGVNAVTLDGNMDWYVGPDSSPLSGSADRSVEAWVWNPAVPAEETIVAWGRRGGPDASNWSMLYGNHGTWGALGGWGGAADMPFVAGASEAPSINEWHHLVLTYNGQTNERAIYVDGALSNSESDGPIFNTHETDTNGTVLPIILGNQNENNGTRVDNLSAALSIAKVKIHDQSLTLEEVQQSYGQDMKKFGKGGPVILAFNASETRVGPEDSVTLTWDIDNAEIITIDNGMGDVSDEDEFEVVPEETTTYTITATDAEGLTKESSLTVFVLESGALIDIDLTDAELGPLPSIINNGSLAGDFEAEFDVPNVETIDGVNAVTLDGFNDWYVGPDSTPLTGDADRTVEAWVWNPSVPAEETIIAWGRRGGPDATNWSMLYGNHGTWGALGAWGGSADMPFQPGGGNPSINEWHHLVLTYDGQSNERAIYVDGELSNSENDGPTFNTHETDTNGTPLPIVIGNQNENNGTRIDALSAELSIAKLKVHDYSLTLEEVQKSYDNERANFGKGGPRISSFLASSNTINENDTVTLTWDIVGAESISIDNGIGDVTDLDEVEVQPDESITYMITATDSEGISQEKEITIYIIGEANLIHQWSFDENGGPGTTLIDSVGGADGTIVDLGPNDGTVSDGQVTLSGGGKNETDYVRFPPNLVSSLSNMSIETWSTQHSSQNWSRVFSVGSSSSNALHMSFSRGTNINQNELRWNAAANITLQDFGGAPPNP
ncbi:MAG: LamG-like jellyroll fold domain-containing protein, partial [Verrucomicrobiota bacterium]|nr:LamG-like jellyroll fold domain-containing protein [Verrucomicrobiota bacterium]